MNVFDIAKSFAAVGVLGPGPSIYKNLNVLQTLSLAKGSKNSDTSPQMSFQDLQTIKQNGVRLLQLLQPQYVGTTKDGEKSSKYSTSAFTGIRANIIWLVVVSIVQALLTLGAFHATARLAAWFGDLVPALAALLIRLSGFNSPLPSFNAGHRRLAALPLLGVSLSSILALDTRVIPPLRKNIERDLRRKLMHKHFRDTYFNSSMMLRVLSFSQNDIYEAINEDVLGAATSVSTCIALLLKALSQIIASTIMSLRFMGKGATLQFIALQCLCFCIPLLVASKQAVRGKISTHRLESKTSRSDKKIPSTKTFGASWTAILHILKTVVRWITVLDSYKIVLSSAEFRSICRYSFAFPSVTIRAPAAYHNLPLRLQKVPTGSMGYYWVFSSLLLSNICVSITNLLKTFYGPVRKASNFSSDVLGIDEKLKEINTRINAEKRQTSDSFDVKGVDFWLGTDCALQGSKGLSFTVAPGMDLLFYCADVALRTKVIHTIGQFCPLPKMNGSLHTPSLETILYLPQNSFYPRLQSLKQQVIFPKVSKHPTVGENKLLELLEQVGLGDLFNRGDITSDGWATPCEPLSRHLSLQDKQRFGFARALYHKPRFLILDGATSSLDAAEEQALYSLCHSNAITLITVASTIEERYMAMHKNLLQVDSDQSYLFGSIAIELGQHKLPNLRVMSSSQGKHPGTVAIYDAASNKYVIN